MKLRDFNLRALNSATKYPSIPTYHRLGDKGRLQEEVLTPFPLDPETEYEITEKIDGTNTRIVLSPSTREYLIGSREEWLTYVNDVIFNPSQGIVEALEDIMPRLVRRIDEVVASATSTFDLRDVLVIYGEVYGGKINTAKNYTSTGKFGFRVFDMWRRPLEHIAGHVNNEELDVIAKWRDEGNQPFLATRAREYFCDLLGLASVPMLGHVHDVPKSLGATFDWLTKTVGDLTHAGLDAIGKPEGVVIRTPGRKRIAKLRIEDYQRALRDKK